MLAVIKYSNFEMENINSVLGLIGKEPIGILGMRLPLGISFFTFQSVSYAIDVYQGKYECEKNIFKMGLFVSFFPQLLQGPIGRYDRLGKQLYSGHSFNLKNVEYGLQRIGWGLFKKVVIADRAAVLVLNVFNNYEAYSGFHYIMAVLMYSVDLYMDFSGGIDIVIGAAQMFGITMDENFRQPYFSKSIGEFWRRWHISLGTWMKDYIFYPVSMAGWMSALKKKLKKITSRKTATRVAMAIADLLVFALVGIWHGLGTNYLAWGVYNGVILAVSAILVDEYAVWKNKLHIDSQAGYWKMISLIRTLFIVTIGWIFDCTYTAGAAGELFIHLFAFWKTDLSVIALTTTDIVVLLAGCLVLLLVDVLHEKNLEVRQMMGTKNYWVQVAFWTIVVQMIACFGRVASAGGFMYANF